MHSVTFFPLGNADCCRIDLANAQKILMDFANVRNPDDTEDLRIDLASVLRSDLKAANRNYFDVVAFTHADDDHVHGAADFFYLEHAAKYQGEDRIEIKELWVPAAMILEANLQGDAKALRAEARHRLKNGKGIRVFSRPERLKDWLEDEGIKLENRRSLITDAGQLVPGFTKQSEGIEFFVHSPFATRQDDNSVVDRNENSLVLQATFSQDGHETKVMLTADTTHDVWADIVKITRYHKRDERLQWDVFKLPHHCSYLSISSEKGTDKTEPIEEVEWMMEQGGQHGLIVSTSKPIPENDDDPQPPHRQAAAYYKECAASIDGEFKVTMTHPTATKPEPLVITIDGNGATVKKKIIAGSAAVISRPAPRAG